MRLKSIKGFSVIELLIVIAIVAILGTVAIPSFSKFRHNNELREAAQEILADINLYRQKTIAEQTVAQPMRYLLQWFTGTDNNVQCRIWKTTGTTGWGTLTVLQLKNISDPKSSIIIDPTYSNVFNNGWVTGWAWVIVQRRGALGQGSIRLKHLKTNSTATIYTTFLGRVRIEYQMK